MSWLFYVYVCQVVVSDDVSGWAEGGVLRGGGLRMVGVGIWLSLGITHLQLVEVLTCIWF